MSHSFKGPRRASVGRARPVAALLVAAWVAAGTAFLDCESRAAAKDSGTPTRLLLLPTIDLAMGKASLADVDVALRWRLRAMGFDLVAEAQVDSFLWEHRIRYTGGASSSMLKAVREELGADAIFVASVDLVEDSPPPRMALNARIVSTLDEKIRWAGEVTLAGEDRPGLIGSGQINDIDEIMQRAISRLLTPVRKLKLTEDLGPAHEVSVWKHERGRARHRPVKLFEAPEFEAPRERATRVAVLPFENSSTREDAGEIVSGLFSTHLAGRGAFDVIEPGEVRDKLLLGRVIQIDGLSFSQGDWVREMLDADIAVTGRVTEWADYGSGTVSRVGFAVWIIDVRRRVVVWSGFSSNQASDGVIFFDVGQMTSARALAGGMVRAAVDVLVHPGSQRR